MTGEGVVVIGGAVVVRRDDGWYTQSRFLKYLEDLAHELGSVIFFATQAHSVPAGVAFNAWVDPARIHVEPIQFIQRSGVARKLLATLGDARRLEMALARARAVVHFFPAAGGLLGLLAMACRGRAHLTYFKSDWIDVTNNRPGLARMQAPYWALSEALEARVADALVFRSQAHMRRLARHARGDVEVAQPIISTSAVERIAPRDPRPDEPLNVLYVGGLYPEKGLGDLISAVRALADDASVPSFRVTLVGGQAAGRSGKSSSHVRPEWLSAQISEAGIESRIETTGYVDNNERLATLYRQSHIFVLPSWSEGFPRVIDEAASYGLAIVTTTVGGIPAVLQHGNDALLVPPRQPEALALALREVLVSSSTRKRLAGAARLAFERRVREPAAKQHVRLLRAAWRRNT